MTTTQTHKVATDALDTLGTIIDETAGRDAIHLAVEPTVAAEKLFPGQDVGVDGTSKNPVGIVDPFLKVPVLKGERFWLVVYPRQITSLRHVWEHPAFSGGQAPVIPNINNKAASIAWLADYWCSEYEDFETFIRRAVENEDGDYFIVYGHDAGGPVPWEFWDHIEAVAGRRAATRARSFSCSC